MHNWLDIGSYAPTLIVILALTSHGMLELIVTIGLFESIEHFTSIIQVIYGLKKKEHFEILANAVSLSGAILQQFEVLHKRFKTFIQNEVIYIIAKFQKVLS